MHKTCPHCGGTAEQVHVTWDQAVRESEAAHGFHASHNVHRCFPLLALGGFLVTGVRALGHKFFTFRCNACGRES